MTGRPRITIRWLMAGAMVPALALGLGLPAREVYSHSEIHDHAYVGLIEGQPSYRWDQGIKPPFWPRYWRRLMGRPEFEKGNCGAGEGRLAETCTLAHPEIVGDIICRGPAVNPTTEMVAAFNRLIDSQRQKSPASRLPELANR
jgi:hypothetical protein